MNDAVDNPFNEVSIFLRRAGKCLSLHEETENNADYGDHLLNPDLKSISDKAPLRDAAVLVPIVQRPSQATVLLTQRSEALPTHAGQIAFPGGKIEGGEGALAAALREAEEEVGLLSSTVKPIGFLPPYITATGYRIMPLIGYIEKEPALSLNRDEVEYIIEVPLSFLMDPKNHVRESRIFHGKKRYFYAMPYNDHYIWGATAGIIRHLFEMIYMIGDK